MSLLLLLPLFCARMVIEEYADLMAFLSNALGAEWVDTE